MIKVYSVILAAGSSTRLGFNKLTVKIDSEEVIRMAVRPFLEANVGEVIVVINPDTPQVARALEGQDVRIVHNTEHLKGMSSSVRAVLPHIGDAEAIFFHLGDKPFVKKELLYSILGLYRERTGGIVVPVHNGIKGHPVMMSYKSYKSDMEHLEGDKGLREVIEKYAADVVFIESDESILFDIDTLEDIENLKERGYLIEKGEG